LWLQVDLGKDLDRTKSYGLILRARGSLPDGLVMPEEAVALREGETVTMSWPEGLASSLTQREFLLEASLIAENGQTSAVMTVPVTLAAPGRRWLWLRVLAGLLVTAGGLVVAWRVGARWRSPLRAGASLPPYAPHRMRGRR